MCLTMQECGTLLLKHVHKINVLSVFFVYVFTGEALHLLTSLPTGT